MNQPLPKQIADQLKEAEELEKALTTPPEEAPTEAPAEVVEIQGESQEPEATEVETQPAAEPVETVSDDDRWEAKYKTLQSKYDAEVPRLHQQNRELGTQLDRLQMQVESLSAKPEPTEEPKQEIHRSVSEQDEETFGKDLIDLQRRVTREETAKLHAQIEGMKNELVTLRKENSSLKQATNHTAMSQYMMDLNRMVPDWETINTDEGWLNWLAVEDPITGMTRQQALDSANNRQDASRVSAIFNAYKSGLQKTAEPTQELQRQVTPKRSASSPKAQPEKKVWMQSEIAEALDPRNLKKMTAEQIEVLMSEIDAAQAEGRIR